LAKIKSNLNDVEKSKMEQREKLGCAEKKVWGVVSTRGRFRLKMDVMTSWKSFCLWRQQRCLSV